MPSTVLHVRVNETDMAKLEELADTRGIPVSTLARSFLAKAIARESDPAETARSVLNALEEDPRLRYRLSRMLIMLPQESD